jgi:flagellar hook-basal body complex protein FliE
MSQINPIGPIQEAQQVLQSSKVAAGAGAGAANAPSFKDTLNGFLSDVNSMQVKADESINRMAAGEITDVHQVMTAVEEANTAFNMMMEIRNKVMDAYQEVERMRL